MPVIQQEENLLHVEHNIVKSLTEIGNEMYSHFNKNISDLTAEVAELRKEIRDSNAEVN